MKKRTVINEITLLSLEECNRLPPDILKSSARWWLRSPGNYDCYIACIEPSGNINIVGNYASSKIGVRPVLKVDNIGPAKPYETISLLGREWIVISDTAMLCKDIITRMPFRNDWRANDADNYDTSDIKTYLNLWMQAAQDARM